MSEYIRLAQLINENGEHTRFEWDVMDRLSKETGFDASRYTQVGLCQRRSQMDARKYLIFMKVNSKATISNENRKPLIYMNF